MNAMPLLILTGLLLVTEPEHDPAEPVVETTIEMYGINAEAVPMNLDYVEHVCEVCMEYELDPAVLFAMMWQESRFTPNAVGDHGQSFGILQIKRRWHEDRIRRLGVTDLMNEWQEIYVACDYLAEIRETYPSIQQMLTVYRYGDLTVTGEDYAGTVMAKAEEFRR